MRVLPNTWSAPEIDCHRSGTGRTLWRPSRRRGFPVLGKRRWPRSGDTPTSSHPLAALLPRPGCFTLGPWSHPDITDEHHDGCGFEASHRLGKSVGGRDPRAHQAVRGERRRQRRRAPRPPGLRLRLPGAQWSREDDPHPGAAGPDPRRCRHHVPSRSRRPSPP